MPSHDVLGSSSKARDARWRGRSWKRPDESKRSGPRQPASRSSVESGGVDRRVDPRAHVVGASAGREHDAVDLVLGVGAVLGQLQQRAAGLLVAAVRIVGGGPLEQIGEADPAQVAPAERLRAQHRRAQRLVHVHAGDAHLAQAAVAAQVGVLRLSNADQRDPHLADVLEVDGDRVPAVVHLGAHAVDVDLGHLAARVAEREQLDDAHVARLVEADLDPAAARVVVAVGRPDRAAGRRRRP